MSNLIYRVRSFLRSFLPSFVPSFVLYGRGTKEGPKRYTEEVYRTCIQKRCGTGTEEVYTEQVYTEQVRKRCGQVYGTGTEQVYMEQV